jgi:citrate lyase subunit beta / citryl-CoA lyase
VSARSYLYVPGDRPDRLAKALEKAGDAVIADLEDAVAPSRKDVALETVVTWLAEVGPGPEVWVRVGAGPRAADELAAVGASPRLTGVVLAKASVAGVAEADAVLPPGVRVSALVETASGVLELAALAAHPRVSRLGLGEADLAGELGIAPGEPSVLLPVRAQAVVASAAAGIDPPTGPVHVDLRDLEGLRASTEGLRRAGFGARSAVHPDQVPVIEEVLTPTAAEVAQARETVEAWDAAVAAGTGVAVDARGRMVDEAVVRLARRVVATADRLGL